MTSDLIATVLGVDAAVRGHAAGTFTADTTVADVRFDSLDRIALAAVIEQETGRVVADQVRALSRAQRGC